MRLLAFDIEASGLNADFGIVICVGFQEVGTNRTQVMSLLDYDEKDPIKAERLLLKDVRERLLDCDAWIAHFGKYYDVVFVNTRLLYHRLPTLPTNFPLIDTWRTAKNAMKLRNNRLITIQEFLGTRNEKNAILPEQWIRAMAGQPRAIKYIIDHCKRDIEVLVEVYLRLRPLIVDHPNHNLIKKDGGCPTCGSMKLQKRGQQLAKTMAFQRFQCQACGAWSKSRKAVSKAEVRAF